MKGMVIKDKYKKKQLKSLNIKIKKLQKPTTHHLQMRYIAEGKVNGELYRNFGNYYKL